LIAAPAYRNTRGRAHARTIPFENLDVLLGARISVELAASEPQPTPHETRRIVFEDGRWFHQALLGGTWMDVYEFTREEMPPIDREVGNWYTSSAVVVAAARFAAAGPVRGRGLGDGDVALRLSWPWAWT